MSRDWKKDMDMLKETDGWEFEPTFDGVGNIFDDSGRIAKVGVSYAGTIFNAFEALKYWLHQYAEEKERANMAYLAYKGLAEDHVNRGEYESLLDKHTAMTKAYRAEKERADKLHNAVDTCLTAGNSLASLIMGYDLPEGHEEWTHQNANSYFFGQFYNDRQTAYERYETWLAWKSIKDVAASLYPKEETKRAVLEEEEAK